MDGLTLNNDDMIQAVRESAMLADVSVSVWNAEKSDRGAMDDLKARAGATGNIGRVVKNMLAGADTKLKDVRSAFTAVRTLHYGLTLPWVADPHALRATGPRLLPHLLFERYLMSLSKQRNVAINLLNDFLVDYPSYVVQAKANLGTLADVTYPTADEVKAAFRVHFDFEPLPAGASFKGLPDHTIERLAGALEAKQKRMVAAATAAMWDEAKERIGHICAKLGDPEAKFKASSVENVRELITLLPGFNMTGLPEVDEVVADIKAMLDKVDAVKLRDNALCREDTAVAAKKIADKLTSWGV
jgi:hypothetical protein